MRRTRRPLHSLRTELGQGAQPSEVAKSRGRAGEQERPHPVGGAGQEAAVRPQSCVGEAAGACHGRADRGRLKEQPDSK